MKKIIPIIVCALSLGVVAVVYFCSDRKAPTINVNNVPNVSCSLKYEDLMDYASSDDSDLKSMFVEEKDLSEIANNGYLTFVAIDDDNNVSKKKVDVSVAPELVTYHIELLQPLKAQIYETFKTSEYLALRNECGWNVKDTFNIEGVNYNLKGEYEVKITSKVHSDVEPLITTMEVKDYKAPVINLYDETIETYSGLTFSDDYFLSNVESVEDDNDDPDELINRVTTNWEDVMFPYSTGYVDKEGTYTITYRVTDSEGNTGTSTLRLTLRRQEVYYDAEGDNNG